MHNNGAETSMKSAPDSAASGDDAGTVPHFNISASLDVNQQVYPGEYVTVILEMYKQDLPDIYIDVYKKKGSEGIFIRDIIEKLTQIRHFRPFRGGGGTLQGFERLNLVTFVAVFTEDNPKTTSRQPNPTTTTNSNTSLHPNQDQSRSDSDEKNI